MLSLSTAIQVRVAQAQLFVRCYCLWATLTIWMIVLNSMVTEDSLAVKVCHNLANFGIYTILRAFTKNKLSLQLSNASKLFSSKEFQMSRMVFAQNSRFTTVKVSK